MTASSAQTSGAGGDRLGRAPLERSRTDLARTQHTAATVPLWLATARTGEEHVCHDAALNLWAIIGHDNVRQARADDTTFPAPDLLPAATPMHPQQRLIEELVQADPFVTGWICQSTQTVLLGTVRIPGGACCVLLTISQATG